MTEYIAGWITPLRFMKSKKRKMFNAAIGLGTSEEELEAMAWLEVCIAAKRFDPTRGNSFATYAHWYVWKALNEAIQQKTMVTRNPETSLVSLDTRVPGGGGDQVTLHQLIGTDDLANMPANTDDVADDDMKAFVAERLGSLKDRQAEILRRRYGIDREVQSLQEIGRHFRVSKERVRQLEYQAKTTLRKNLKDTNAFGDLTEVAA